MIRLGTDVRVMVEKGYILHRRLMSICHPVGGAESSRVLVGDSFGLEVLSAEAVLLQTRFDI